jgi:hypothetical protein
MDIKITQNITWKESLVGENEMEGWMREKLRDVK